MHPALSVIFFTTSSGAGYGMIVWLGLLAALGLAVPDGAFGAASVFVALVLISAGLLSSTLHLGRPKVAWRAVSQWRTSWLSREGVAALLTYIPVVLFGLVWFVVRRPDTATTVLGLVAVAMALITIGCTAMIYASLKPIRQWRHPLVLPSHLLIALYTGAIWLAAITAFWHGPAARLPGVAAIVLGLIAIAAKLAYWHAIDTGPATSTIESATGLGALGKVRMLEAPHTEENYLLREMGYAIGRKHAHRLRVLATVIGWALPLLLVLAALLLPALAAILLAGAAIACFLGALAERWLFFAEATHTVTLFYGREAA